MSGRWIVFDAVGTLIEPEPDVATVYHSIGRQHGSRLSRSDVAARFHAAFQADETGDRSAGRLTTSESAEADRWRRIVGAVLDDVYDHGRCFQDLFDHFGRPAAWRCFNDVAETLAGLAARGYRLAVASNFDRRLHAVCDEPGPLSRLERRVVSSEVGWRKPAVAFYEAVMLELSARPDEILVVGDDPVNDVDAARSAGIRAVHLDRKRQAQNPALSANDSAITSLTELLERFS